MILTGILIFPDLRPPVAAKSPASADALRQLEAEFMKAAAEKGAQGYMS
jgi:hypothetical protein